MKIEEFLIKNEIYPNLLGFGYLIKAVKITKRKGKISTTKTLYPLIAKEYKTSPTKVERAIRHVLHKISLKGYKDIGICKQPTNSELIYYLANFDKVGEQK